MNAVWSQPVGTADELTTTTERTSAGRRCRWRRVAASVALVAVAVIAVVAWRTRSAAPMPVAAAAPVALNVHSLGYLEPKSEVIRLAAPSTMEQTRVERLLVAEGDTVRSGDVLAVLDNYQRRSGAVAEAEARVAVEQAKLEQIKAGAKPGDLAAQKAMVSPPIQSSMNR